MTKYVKINEGVETYSGGTLVNGEVYPVHVAHDNGGVEILDVEKVNYYFGAPEVTVVEDPAYVQNSEEGYYEIPEDDDFDEADKFQPGAIVDWVYEDGSSRANGYWDGSEIEEPCATAGYEGYYMVKHPEHGQGCIHGDYLRLHEQPEDSADDSADEYHNEPYSLSDAANKPYTMTFSVIPEVKDPSAPTAEELSKGYDISDYVEGFPSMGGSSDFSAHIAGFAGGYTQHDAYSINGEDVEDLVNAPNHYSAGMPEGIEVRDIIKAQGFWKEFCAGNVIKYSLRWQYKNGIEDLRKLNQYSQWLVEELEDGE